MHAVIIGSGFGGLALAVRLAVKGYAVTILEKLDRPGGRGRVFEQDGFTFDAGPTIITAPYLLEDLFTLAGRRIEDYVTVFPVDPFYRVRFDDGTTFDYSGDPAKMREEVRRLCPGDVAGYERFMEKSRQIFEKGYLELGHVPFLTPWSMVRAVPNRKSHDEPISTPTPRHGPWAARIVGFSIRSISSNTSCSRR